MDDRRMHAEHDAEKWHGRYLEAIADRDRLAAERDALDCLNKSTVAAAKEALAARDALAQELADVLEYTGHKPGCMLWYTKAILYGAECTCGWTALRERHAKGKHGDV